MSNSDKKKFVSADGTVYESYEAYCNSPDLDSDQIQLKLFRGLRTPQNDYEKGLMKDIEKARKKGTFLEIYPE